MAGRPKRRAMITAIEKLGGESSILEMIEDGAILPDIAAKVSELMDGDNSIGRKQLGSWLNRTTETAEAVVRAREASADAIADEALEATRLTAEGTSRSSAVKIKGLQWQASKRNRERYGDTPTVAVQINAASLLLASLLRAPPPPLEPSVTAPMSLALTSVKGGDMAQIEASDEG